MPESEFDLRVDAARKELKDPEQVTVQNGDPTSHPRFEVWHWGQSLCSQKVRTVLTEKEIEYRSNELSFREFENYRPGYVRLRMYAAGPENLKRLAVEHTMRTSVKTEGFDACVVPLLVDHDKRRAIVDSAKIISYIEREVPPVPLIPENPELAAAVDKQVAINDTIPHPGILYGFHKNDPRPDFQIHIMQNIYDAKREALEFLIEQNKDDDELVRVYRAKITKEMAGKKLQKDPAYMAKILNEFRGLIANLDKDLEIHESPWICGQDYTMADCIWGISLYRIQWLGHAGLWDKYPGVQDYAHRLYKRPSFQKAYIKWDNSRPQSPHTVEIDAA